MTRDAPLFQIETVYDEAAYAALAYLMMRHVRRWPRYMVLGTGLASVCLSGYAMISTGEITWAALLFLLLGNLFMLFGIFAKQFVVRLMMAGNKKGEPPENRYAFYPDRIRITTRTGDLEYTYPFLRRVLDMQGYLFFFFRDGKVFLLRHGDLEPESRKALTKLIDDRLAKNKEDRHAVRQADRQ